MRTARDIITRATPLKIRLMPTRVPIAQAALEGPLAEDDLEAVGFTLGRIEAALRARVVAKEPTR